MHKEKRPSNSSRTSYTQADALSVTSLALGSVGLLLFFLPVLGIPLAGAGALFAAISLATAIVGGQSLRWPVAGLLLCLIALGVDVIIIWSPEEGFRPHQATPRTWTSPTETLYVSPPGR